jgi:methylmalonyl-CoA mutase N-terminal domain/subunit
VVGVNCYRADGEAPPAALEIDARAEAEQVERLRAFRAARDADAAAAARAVLAGAAAEDRNVMPGILECVRAGATLGEIADTLREVFGEHREAAGA